MKLIRFIYPIVIQDKRPRLQVLRPPSNEFRILLG